ncbi:MAG: NAD(+) diphosphatase [Actinomycetota bacterium]
MFEPRLVPLTVGEVADWICVRDGAVLVRTDRGGAFPSGAHPPVEGQRHHLGLLAGRSVWAVDVTPPADDDGDDGLDPDLEWVGLRALFGRIDDGAWVLAGRAHQVIAWDRDHRFCGRCGSETLTSEEDRARVCPSCGLRAYPRLTPAVIMLIRRDDEVLLAHGRQFPGRFYSALAGFVEPGEDLEEAVAREVREEVGIEITDIRYFGSQPWPFPHSLMIGFTARWASGELDIDPTEIVDAGWFRADDLPPAPIGGMSIAGWMMQAWLDGRLDESAA